MEKAEAFVRLKEEFGLFDREIAEIMGKSREVITNTIRFLNLSELAKQALRNEQISEGHAKVLLSFENREDHDRFLKLTIDEKLTVRELEKKIKEFKNPKKVLSVKDRTYLEEFENRFKQILKYDNLKVMNNNKNYQIVINFKSEEEMENWMKKL